MTAEVVDIMHKLAENSPIIAALFIVCGVAVAILYYLVQQHLPAQTLAFNQAITTHREAFGEALKQHAEQSTKFIEYMKTAREAETKALTQVLDRMLATHERQTDELAKEIKAMGSAFVRLRSAIHQHHDIVRAQSAGGGMVDVELEDRDAFDDHGRTGRARS